MRRVSFQASRRDAVSLGKIVPWVETHGYVHPSLRDGVGADAARPFSFIWHLSWGCSKSQLDE